VSRLTDALQRAHAVREQNRIGLQADAPACRLEEAPLPPVAAFDPALETGDLDAAHDHSRHVRRAIFAAAGVLLAILIAWYLFEAREQPQPAKSQGLKLEQELSPRR